MMVVIALPAYAGVPRAREEGMHERV